MEAFEQRPLIFDAAEVGRAGVFVTLDRDGGLAVYRGYVRPEDEPREETVANFGDDLGTEGQGANGSVSAYQLAASTSAATIITSGGQPVSSGLVDDEDDGVLKPLPERLVMELTAHRTLALREAIDAAEREEGRGVLRAVRGERNRARWLCPFPPFPEISMTHVEPTLAAPMPPSSIDFAQVFAEQAERSARIDELRPANRDRLFDGLSAAGITHVTVTFDGEGDSGQIESIGAWAGDKAVDFPAVEIPYAALTWDNPEVEMRQLSLEDVVEQLAYDFLADAHGGWENNDGAYGEFCFDASARSIHLEFNERFTSSELFTHEF